MLYIDNAILHSTHSRPTHFKRSPGRGKLYQHIHIQLREQYYDNYHYDHTQISHSINWHDGSKQLRKVFQYITNTKNQQGGL